MSISSPTNICDFNSIDNNKFQYSLPKSLLEEFLSGKTLDNLEIYTNEESEQLQNDINDLYESIIAKNPEKEKKVHH